MTDPLRELTLVVPTHNRPGDLRYLLEYLRVQSSDLRIRVLDSSGDENAKINRQSCARAIGEPIEYLHFPHPQYPQMRKYLEGIRSVGTPFVALCADDDVVVIEAMRECVRNLTDNPSTAAAHGRYFNFSSTREFLSLQYNRAYDDPKPVRRIVSLFRHYEPNFYAVHRVPNFVKALIVSSHLETDAFKELAMAATIVAQGKVDRLDCLYYGRRNGPQSEFSFWHPLQILRAKPELICAEHARLVDTIKMCGDFSDPDSARTFAAGLWAALFEYMATITKPANTDALLVSLERDESASVALHRFVGEPSYSTPTAVPLVDPIVRFWHKELDRFAVCDADLMWPLDAPRPLVASLARRLRSVAIALGVATAENLARRNGWTAARDTFVALRPSERRQVAKLLRQLETFEVDPQANQISRSS